MFSLENNPVDQGSNASTVPYREDVAVPQEPLGFRKPSDTRRCSHQNNGASTDCCTRGQGCECSVNGEYHVTVHVDGRVVIENL